MQYVVQATYTDEYEPTVVKTTSVSTYLEAEWIAYEAALGACVVTITDTIINHTTTIVDRT